MNLIDGRGLNCHLASIISIADSLGVNYPDAFATLWSETDFTDDPIHNVYVSKRVYANLDALGVKTEALHCHCGEAAESLSLIANQEPFLIGMDTFYTPWSPVYQYFYGPHYFIAQKVNANTVDCFDPIYHQNGVKICTCDILDNANALIRIHKAAGEPPPVDVRQEARAILHGHPVLQETLWAAIQIFKEKDRKKMSLVIKQIDAMINNRHLFQRYLHQSPVVSGPHPQLFDPQYFLRWDAIKNGLCKASIIKNNESVVDEVCTLFASVMLEENAMAERLIA